jgi:CBS domain-containing protein
MRCEMIMKKNVAWISPRDTAMSAARRMRDENIGFLPVCDDDGIALGTLTDRDIAVRLVADDRPASVLAEVLMTREVVACRPDDDIEEAEKLMAAHCKSRVMCVDDRGRLVGVISLSDIAQYDRTPRVTETLRRITEREVHI